MSDELRDVFMTFRDNIVKRLDRIIEIQRDMGEKIDRYIEENRRKHEEFRSIFLYDNK